MAQGTFSRRLGALVPVFLVGLGLALVPAPAGGAANAGPIQVPLRDPGPNGCPTGSYVATNPGPISSPYFVLKEPGPNGCAPGTDVLRDPGPQGAPQGIAVALPITAADCTQGTALFDTELLMLGAALPGPSSSPGGPATPCPSGDAALSNLEAAIANVPVAPGSFGIDAASRVALLPAVQNPGGFILVYPGTSSAPGVAGVYGDALIAGFGTEVVVAFLEGDPDTPILVSSPSSFAPGVSVLKAPGPSGAPTLDDAVCIEIGGIWQQPNTCEIAGAGTVSGSFTIPAATTLLVDPGGSLTLGPNASLTDLGIVTIGGSPANPGNLTVAGSGTLTLGPGGTLNDTGVVTVGGNPANPGNLTVAGSGTLTLGPGGTLNDTGVVTVGGNPANPGNLTVAGGGTLTLGPGGTLNDTGVVTVGGGPANPGNLTVAGGGTLTLSPGATLDDTGVVTIGGGPANPGNLTVAGSGTLTLGPGGTLNDTGVVTVGGNVNNNGSYTIDTSGITTVQQGGSLVNGGTLTLNGSLINNGSFLNQGVFVDNGTCVNC